MIYFVVDEYEETNENVQNQEDLNMNTAKDQNNATPADNNVVVNKYRQYNNSMEMSELNEGKTEEKEVPKVAHSRHNLLSEGIFYTCLYLYCHRHHDVSLRKHRPLCRNSFGQQRNIFLRNVTSFQMVF
jgi:hypothetical protein